MSAYEYDLVLSFYGDCLPQHGCSNPDNYIVQNRQEPDPERAKAVGRALSAELLRRFAHPIWQLRPIRSVRFILGGPHHFSLIAFRKAMATITRSAKVSPRFRVHADIIRPFPHTQYMRELARHGVNAVTIHADSFDPESLRRLGVRANPSDGASAVESAKAAAIPDVGVQLMFGFPRQRRTQFRYDLEMINRLQPTRAFIYPWLKADLNGSVLRKFFSRELSLKMREKMLFVSTEVLDFGGYEPATFSRYVRSGQSWDGRVEGDFMGVGPGAQSVFTNELGELMRSRNLLGWEEYEKAVLYGQSVKDLCEPVLEHQHVALYFDRAFRSDGRVDVAHFEQCFGLKCDDLFPGLIKRLVKGRYIEHQGMDLVLTRRGVVVMENLLSGFRPSANDLEFARSRSGRRKDEESVPQLATA